jgi:hypothetical protein
MRTYSGAVALCDARKDGGRVVILEHVGLARTDGELEVPPIAFGEGPGMEHLAREVLLLWIWGAPLNWKRTAKRSRARYWQETLDDLVFERLNGPTCINLTGDNTGQPHPAFFTVLTEACLKDRPAVEKFLAESRVSLSSDHSSATGSLLCLLLHRGAKLANAIVVKMEKMENKWNSPVSNDYFP